MKSFAMVNLRRFLSPIMLLFLAGCAADPVSLKVENSLPPDKLAYYSDPFDSFRDDLWDKSAVLYKDTQMENFQLAEMIYRNGKLTITTKKDCFSKRSLGSRFALQGDFDIQLDCRFNLLRGYQPMDQGMLLAIFDRGSGQFDNFDLVIIGVYKNKLENRVRLFSKAKFHGRSSFARSERIQGFQGSFRMVREGRKVTTYYRQRSAPWKKVGSFPFSTSNLTVGFLLQNAIGPKFYSYLGLVPAWFWGKFYVWQLVTYIFLHGGLFHLLFNLFALWIFGCEIERHMGSGRFIQYFFITAIGAGICTVILMYNQRVLVMGASGGIYGLLLAYAWFFPERQIYVWFMFPMKAKYFVLLFGAIEFWSSLRGTGSGIAHFAHLGGILFGLLYFNYYRIWRWFRLMYLKSKYRNMGGGPRDSDEDKWDGWGRA